MRSAVLLVALAGGYPTSPLFSGGGARHPRGFYSPRYPQLQGRRLEQLKQQTANRPPFVARPAAKPSPPTPFQQKNTSPRYMRRLKRSGGAA
jgi:hypothetical protein